MKKFIQILSIALLGVGLIACESLKLGDAGLSKAPETSGATIDTLFATINDADKVLTSAYYYLPYGLISDFDSKMGGDFLESITDHFISNKHSDSDGPNNLYYSGGLSANLTGSYAGGENYRFGSEKDYTCIRYAWLFLENADRIPEADPVLLARKKAEAKVCMAIAYANMLRYLGGVPILDHAVQTDEEMKYPRATFAETVDFIVNLCNEAAPDLPWTVSATDNGRMTRAAALGLKLRVLCFAASPTFNSDTPWHPDADEYTRYADGYKVSRWEAAKAAADEFMKEQLSNGGYALEQATPANPLLGMQPRDYRLAYRKGYFDRASSEVIISIRKNNSTSYHDSHFEVQGSYGSGCSLNWVNKFPWADGEPFPEDFDWENKANWPEYPFFRPDPNGTLKVGSSTFTETRDPRLYENVAVPGDIWRDGTVGRAYDNHKYHQDGCPGFLMMKYVLQQSNDRSIPPHWCMMRFAEVLLNAAEAYNEADGGPSDKAYSYVNAVRARVGLPGLPEGMTKEEFRKALILERELEFGFEEVRWFDMIRWGLKEAFTTPLKGLTSFGDKNAEATVFTFKEKIAYPSRPAWENSFDTKWYLAPIPAIEINKNYGMTQNPGWK
ncbi:MAG: RagB/SusD family nutrient uptake outer membrane protein [Bacteroidales bacterium]|nr:RagB/SusD family nutrient uptake outer membrane protein [Bacteroidales bacterium]